MNLKKKNPGPQVSLNDAFIEFKHKLRQEIIKLPSGNVHVVYYTAAPTEGPYLGEDRYGNPVLGYMYFHFVFLWTEGNPNITVGHGTVNNYIELPQYKPTIDVSKYRWDDHGHDFACWARKWYEETMSRWIK